MKKGAIAAVIALLAVVLIAAFVMMNKEDDDTASSSTTTTSSDDSSNSGRSENSGPGNAEDRQTQPSGSQSSTAQTDKVSMRDMVFTPKEITVKKGTTVTWTNDDSVPHNVIGDGGNGPQSGTIDEGGTYSFTFNEVGTFTYECTLHPGMTGKVTVTE